MRVLIGMFFLLLKLTCARATGKSGIILPASVRVYVCVSAQNWKVTDQKRMQLHRNIVLWLCYNF